MKNILLTAFYEGKAREIVEHEVPEGFELVMLEKPSQEALYKKAYLADYILASEHLKIDESVLTNAVNLKMVQRMGTGQDSLDLQALKRFDIPVYINRGINARSVAEHTIMFILASLRNLPIVNKTTKAGIWKKREYGVNTRTLKSQTVGLLGLGNIGSMVASMLQPFGCRIIYYSPNRKKDMERRYGLKYVTAEQLYKQADILSLHCQLNELTKGIINADSIYKMKRGICIINTARGGLINETDLLAALNEGQVAIAALDVFNNEPLINSRLISHDNVICSPHIAGNTFDSFTEMAKCALRNIALFENGDFDKIKKYKITI